MKNKIRKVLLDTLKSSYDNGDIDDGGIIGGDNAVDQLYDLFVDEATFVRHLENSTVLYPEKKTKKIGDILYTNSKTGKTQKLFDTLIPVFGVRCDDTITIGDKGCSVYYTIQAKDEEEAIAKALKNKEFTKHIRMKNFDRKYLSVYKPTGNYVIGKVNYYEGDERL
ncbi:MAG: hypothetical protein WC428_01735 [Candidatus Paceibacterota bacterium]|jgi:hypothetical protein